VKGGKMNGLLKLLVLGLISIAITGCDTDSLRGGDDDNTQITKSPLDTSSDTGDNANNPDDTFDTDNTVDMPDDVSDEDDTTTVEEPEDIDNADEAPDYSYIPKGDSLTDEMIYRFLNMTTFGATTELVQEVKNKGIIQWVDEQLAMKYNKQKESLLLKTMEQAIRATPWQCNRDLYMDDSQFEQKLQRYMQDYLNNSTQFDNSMFNYCGNDGHYAARAAGYGVFQLHVEDKAQLRQRVAYALSQIIIASESNDHFFKDRYEALAYYYDILQKDAFTTYGKVLYDVTYTPAMAIYLSYAGNQKEHIDTKTGAKVTADENYGREIMQLFTLGLYKRNLDGSIVYDGSSKRVASYTQKDVNEISKVFTGLSVHSLQDFGKGVYHSDTIHPVRCYDQYHDTSDKHFLNQSVMGSSCSDEIKATIDILVNHQSTAPNISKKLILRLTKSNPKSDYVKRVATVFQRTQGDLKEVVKAIVLDPEIWRNIKEGKKVKIKEPYMAFTHLARVFKMKPFAYVDLGDKNKSDYNHKRGRLLNSYYFWGFGNGLYAQLGQWPLQSPTVFNFYSDEYKTNSAEFKVRGFVAPEAEILTSKYVVNTFNRIGRTLTGHPLYVQVTRAGKDDPKDIEAEHPGYLDYYKISYEKYYKIYMKYFGNDLLKAPKDAKTRDEYLLKALNTLVDKMSIDLLGHKLKDRDRDAIINKLKNNRFNYSKNTVVAKSDLARIIISRVAMHIVMSEEFMTE
jgi:uncharacterized protein (DUF1800 family)